MDNLWDERAHISEELDKLSKNLGSNATVRLLEEGSQDPVVGILYEGDRVEFLYPKYKNQKERKEAFDKLNQYIRDTDGIGCVMVMESWFTSKGETVRKEALITLAHGPGVNVLSGFSFIRDEKGRPVINERLGPETPRNSLIDAFDHLT